MIDYATFASPVLDIAHAASRVVMEYYELPTEALEVSSKQDHSPVTAADMAAHSLIVSALIALTPDIPVVSEEYAEKENLKFEGKKIFWLVDPLDGTKSFMRHRPEFTVNIALIVEGVPIGGAVTLPAQNTAYFVGEDGHAYKQKNGHPPLLIRTRDVPKEGAVVIASRSHSSPETEAFIAALPNVAQRMNAASSLKLCLIAEGIADIYPRFGPTCEWDIAAGHAVLLAAGGSIVTSDGQDFLYGKKGFLNGNFIARGEK